MLSRESNCTLLCFSYWQRDLVLEWVDFVPGDFVLFPFEVYGIVSRS